MRRVAFFLGVLFVVLGVIGTLIELTHGEDIWRRHSSLASVAAGLFLMRAWRLTLSWRNSED